MLLLVLPHIHRVEYLSNRSSLQALAAGHGCMGKAQKEEHEGEEGGVDVASEEVHDLLPVSSLAGTLARGGTSGVLTVAGALSVHLQKVNE